MRQQSAKRFIKTQLDTLGRFVDKERCPTASAVHHLNIDRNDTTVFGRARFVADIDRGCLT